MNPRSRRIAAVLSAAAITALSAVALAWACTPQASISVSPGSGAPGSSATVSGSAFTSAPVSIRWGSATGPQIGSAMGPSFSVRVTIPQAAPDVYYIVAVGPAGTSAVPFEVISPAGAKGPGTPSTTPGGDPATTPGGNAGGGGGGADADSGGRPGTTTGGGTRRDAGSDSQTTAGGSGNATTTRGGSRSARPRARAITQALPSPGGARGGEAGAASGTVTTASGQQVFAGSLPTLARRRGTKSGAGASSAAAPSERSAGADLWGGFAAGERPSLGSADGIALEDERAGAAPAVGLALLTLGLAGLCGGVLVAGAKRRRRAESAAGYSQGEVDGR